MRSCGKDGKDKSYLIRYHVVNPCKSKVETQLQKVLNLEVHNGTIAGGLFIKNKTFKTSESVLCHKLGMAQGVPHLLHGNSAV